MFLDFILSFNEHLEKGFGNCQQRYCYTSQTSIRALLTIYKAFICHHFDHSDVIYDPLYNDSFHAKLESHQYKAALIMTGALKESSIY